MNRMQVLSEFWEYMKLYRKFWLAPIIIIMLLLGFVLIMVKGSALAPFIYTLF